MRSAAYGLIRQAILNKEDVRATYPGYVRDMSPHMLGTKGGTEQGLFFQFAGGSRSGLSPGGEWRCLTIAQLSDVSIVEGPWHTKSDYSPDTDDCVGEINVEVDPEESIQ